jgi:uncharacterized membrane protein required for colicin V production
MAILDIVCGAIIIVFAIFGVCKGFARQVLKLASGIVAVVGALLLLKPVFDILYSLDFFKGIIDTLSGAFAGLTFLESYASTLGKTSGALIAEYVIMFGLFVVLSIVIGIVWNILKKIVLPICDLKFIRFFDRLFGLVLGVVWGALLAFGLIYVWSLLKDWSVISSNVPVIGEIYATITNDDGYVKNYVVNNFDKITKFFTDVWTFIKSGVLASA